MYDLVGDIHGHAIELEQLLLHLGYRRNGEGVFVHPQRKVIFLGDLIDRGPLVRETLQIVKGMVDQGSALTVMGNHEYNALCFHTRNEQGEPLRPHTDKHIHQHRATLNAFQDYPEEWNTYLDWMRSLPLWLDLGPFRVIHACWHPEWILRTEEKLKGNILTESYLHESAQKGTDANTALEILLKGIEKELPDGHFFLDKDNVKRTSARIQWWKSPVGKTLAEYALGKDLPHDPVPESFFDTFHYPHQGTAPVFIGHYWLQGKPALQSPSVCCLDYSVAKGGYLLGYRWEGEEFLTENNFVKVTSQNNLTANAPCGKPEMKVYRLQKDKTSAFDEKLA